MTVTKPNYPLSPIGSLDSLCLVLQTTRDELQKLSDRASSYHFVSKKKKKADGTIRVTYDVRPVLKVVHDRISKSLLKKVQYPDYLQGSLKGKDYLTNCKQHLKSKFVISEDISNFFPSIKSKIVYQVWAGVFEFPPEICRMLTNLCCCNGGLVQGSKVSSYLANLVLWEREALLVEYLECKNLRYTRYVDDVVISSKRNVSKREQAAIVGKVYKMFSSIDVKPNKKKHRVMPNGGNQNVHRINVNGTSPSLPQLKRNQIRSAVRNCESEFEKLSDTIEYRKLFNSTLGRVNNMARMHKSEAGKLKLRLLKVQLK